MLTFLQRVWKSSISASSPWSWKLVLSNPIVLHQRPMNECTAIILEESQLVSQKNDLAPQNTPQESNVKEVETLYCLQQMYTFTIRTPFSIHSNVPLLLQIAFTEVTYIPWPRKRPTYISSFLCPFQLCAQLRILPSGLQYRNIWALLNCLDASLDMKGSISRATCCYAQLVVYVYCWLRSNVV